MGLMVGMGPKLDTHYALKRNYILVSESFKLKTKSLNLELLLFKAAFMNLAKASIKLQKSGSSLPVYINDILC